MMQSRFAACRGFSLLELSIVIGIVTLIAGTGMNIISGSLKTADRISTQERLNTIKLALDSFGNTYGFLPCPADRAALPTSAAFGVEARNAGAPANCVATGSGIKLVGGVLIGAVPVRTLGLPDNYAGDNWSDKLLYVVSDDMISSPTSYSTQTGAITISYETTGAWNFPQSISAAYLVLSFGPNGMGAYPFNGSSIPAGKACASDTTFDQLNCSDGVSYMEAPYNDGGTATAFDDFVVWGSNILQQKQSAPAMYNNTCAAGLCEPWCANCTINYPGGGAAVPPATLNANSVVLFKKVIMSDMASCKASCMWGGISSAGYGYQRSF